MNNTDRAWLAGLYEGEGCCSVRDNSKSVSIIMTTTDKDVIEKVQSIFGSGNVTVQNRPNRKESYQWSVGKRNEVERFISETIEFLGQRRTEKFNEALNVYLQRDIRNKERYA